MIWKLIGNVKSFLDKCKRDKINAYSAQSAFFIILSIIPFLMVFSSLLQYTSVTESMLLEIIRHLMPEYVSPFLISLVDEVYSRSMGIISITAIIAIWSAAKGVQYMTDGLNSVNDLEETRNWFALSILGGRLYGGFSGGDCFYPAGSGVRKPVKGTCHTVRSDFRACSRGCWHISAGL